jgi:hypothetical protein
MSIAQLDPRIQELLDYAIATGVPLPMPATVICGLEDAGKIVDLRTGAVSDAEPIMSMPVGLSAAGWERYRELCEVRNAAA